RECGAALCLCSITLFLCVRWSITIFFEEVCSSAFKTDLADIAAAYKFPPLINRTQFQSKGELSTFWVAVLENPKHNRSQVIGFLGLDYQLLGDPSSAELRRMFVSMHHRRRGVGSQLIRVAVAHVQRFAPPLTTLVLETSELQPAARALYEKHGFAL
ncbi:hypothetical protein C8R45DRAFT_778405, partial [Mycena sanguinolenta]